MEKRSGGISRLARRRFLKAVPAAVAAGLAAPSLAQQAQEQRISKDALDCACCASEGAASPPRRAGTAFRNRRRASRRKTRPERFSIEPS